MTGNQTMEYYVRPWHLYSHSRTCTHSICVEDLPDWWHLLYSTSLIVPVFMRFQLSWLVPVYVRHFQPLWRSWSVIYLYPLWRSWSFVYLYHGDSDLCIVHGDDHICVIMFHAYSSPLYSYVSGTAICICSYMQSCIMVLCWLGGWSSIWVPSSLHFWDGQ